MLLAENLYLSGVPVIYDYAHHPTEIKATLDCLSEMGFARIFCVFRPHTYSRTKAFFDDFAELLARPERTVVLDIFPAREEPIAGITSPALCERINGLSGNAVCLDEAAVTEIITPSDYDCILLMGAGDMDRLKNKLISLSDI